LEHESVGRQSAQLPYINHKLVLTGRPVIQNLVVSFEFLMRDNDLISVGLCSNDDSPSGFYVGFSADRWFDDDGVSSRTGYWVNSSNSGYSNTNLSLDKVYRPTIAWTSGQTLNSFNGNNYQYVNPEPVSSLGGEEVQ
jgi:hypothetical protein